MLISIDVNKAKTNYSNKVHGKYILIAFSSKCGEIIS